MNTETSEARPGAVVYGKFDTFDIQTGMAVTRANGRKIGSVVEIAGFGATEMHANSAEGADELVTQASSGTGYIKVTREDVMGPGTKDLYVPFHGIEDVTPEGVILNDAVIAELSQQAEAADS